MLTLRLIRGTRPPALLRRLLVVAAAGGVAFLLLGALDHALERPADPGSALLRMAWCLLPLAAAAQLSVAVARSDPGPTQRTALDAAGLGRGGLPVLAAVQAALCCLLGGAVALLLFLRLRGDLGTLPLLGGTDGPLPAAGPLPLPAALTLLLVLPLTAAVGSAVALRRRPPLPRPAVEPAAVREPAPLGGTALPWVAALVAAGLAVTALAARPTPGGPPLAGAGPVQSPGAGVLAGWLLIAVGLVLAGPVLAALTGRLLAGNRPGALRLLAGRILQAEADRLGGPLGVLLTVACSALAAAFLYGGALLGPFTVLGGAVVLGCAVGTVLTTAAQARGDRTGTADALLGLGAPRGLLRRAVAVRAVALLLVMLPPAWAVAWLATLPLRG